MTREEMNESCMIALAQYDAGIASFSRAVKAMTEYADQYVGESPPVGQCLGGYFERQRHADEDLKKILAYLTSRK